MRETYPYPPTWDELPAREGMRTPYKSRHHAARFTTRTAPIGGRR